jgi:hypothetical protein
MDYRDISLPDFGIFRIRSAISVRSTGLSRFDCHTTYQARYVMFGPPVLADCYTRPRGAVVLRSSTPRTSAYSTELWPTYAYRPQIVLGTSVFDGFGPRLMHRHRHDIIKSIRHIGDPRPTFVQPRQI